MPKEASSDGTTGADTPAVPMAWRAMEAGDLDAVMDIQAIVHPMLQEQREVLADKLALFPVGCRMLGDSVPVAYTFAHPYRIGAVPPLDGIMGTLPADPDCIYIHDVALLPAARRRGAGRIFAAAMAEEARTKGWAALTLVSVYGTVPIWERCGFNVRPMAGLADKFGPVGDTARYMVLAV